MTQSSTLKQTCQHAIDFLTGLDDQPVTATIGADELRERLGVPLQDQATDPTTVINELVEATKGGHLGSAGGRFFASQTPRLGAVDSSRAALTIFGASLPVFGLCHFYYLDITAAMVPTWLPARPTWAILTGMGHLLAGAAILSGTLALLASRLLAAMFSSFVVLVHIPRVLATPENIGEWQLLSTALILTASAWSVAFFLDFAARSPANAQRPSNSDFNHSVIRGDFMLRSTAWAAMLLLSAPAAAQQSLPPPAPAAPLLHDGAHDFDFLIGDWQAVVHRLPDRLVGSRRWLHYRGTSKHHKLLDTNANFEEFLVATEDGQRIKAQTLRLYDPETRQWSIYGLDLDKGQLPLPATIGGFVGNVGTFYDYEMWKGRATLVRFQWFNISPKAARMEQSFSVDGGATWETNWICELSR